MAPYLQYAKLWTVDCGCVRLSSLFFDTTDVAPSTVLTCPNCSLGGEVDGDPLLTTLAMLLFTKSAVLEETIKTNDRARRLQSATPRR